ncbi:MAG: hypothetical protein KDA24_14965 [Deltaproteobacteria bacterium]|nr:hypothetical protein [Deltaproteobacteria bacterium]
MLDAYIIEKIKREQEGQDSVERRRVEIPRPTREPSRPHWDEDRERDPKSDRGVVIIEF